jgi:hypothetical protein
MHKGDDMWKGIVAAVALSVVVPAPSEARVVRFVVEQTRPVLDGTSFGDVGPYERLDGTVYFEVDPRDPLNSVIVNLDKAPRTPHGMVGFSAPFYMLKPVDPARGNGKIFYGVNNRGNMLEYAKRSRVPGGNNNNNPVTAADFGDAFLLRLGYTYVDAGWMGNLARGNDRLVPTLPVAAESDGRPIIAKIRVEFADVDGFSRSLDGNVNHVPRVPYEPADIDTTHATLTVRSAVNGAKTPIPSDRWAFGRCAKGQASLVPTTTELCVFDGFKVDRIYELIYPAKNPMVLGLGYAVTRDLASFLRYQTHDQAGNPNPLAQSPTTVGIRRAYAFGTSSTGMHMRDWLYLGFNEDESHRKVFDAVHIDIPGTHRLFANVEFGDPNNYSRQDIWHDSVSYSYPPLTFAVTTDPISGVRDGILKRPATDPLVFQLDSANEFWQMNASLNVVDGAGRAVPIPDNVRLYYGPSYPHGGGSGLLDPLPPAPSLPAATGPLRAQGIVCQLQAHSGSWQWTSRALLIALDAWADRGVAPPKSNYPTLEDKTLALLDAARAAFPAIPGVKFPMVMNELALPDFGAGFTSTGGRITQLPPTLGKGYQVFVPKPDTDGLDLGGIRTMEVAAPTATLTGWALRAGGYREGDLCGLAGSYIPFAQTKAARQASGDPRPSLEERYGDHAGFVKAVEEASRTLVRERFLLQEDADRYIQAAKGSEGRKLFTASSRTNASVDGRDPTKR